MNNDSKQKRTENKIAYLEHELENLKDHVPDTYQYLVRELDSQQVILKQIEVQECFAAIDRGDDT